MRIAEWLARRGRAESSGDEMLTPTDLCTLEEYRRVMAEVRDTRLVREPVSYSVTFGSQDRDAAQFPDEDALRALFMVFRRLWSEKEPAAFLKVCQVLHRASLPDEEKQGLDEARRYWKETCKSSAFRINLNSKYLSPREYIDMYFNGLYFHGDGDDRERRESLECDLGRPFGRALLLDWVRDLVSAAAFVEEIVQPRALRSVLAGRSLPLDGGASKLNRAATTEGGD